MKSRLILTISILAAMAFGFACGGGAANNANTAANKPANTTVVNATGASNITVTPVGNTASNAPAVNAANKPANSKETANANKDSKPPAGANYLCRDGSYSMGNQDSTACSGHGGVQKPLNDKPQ